MSGSRVLLVACLVLAVGLGGGYLLASQLSEADVASVRAEPTPVPITEEIRELRLMDVLSADGDVVMPAGAPLDLDLMENPVITALLFENGQNVVPGDVLIEIQGRPVIVLPGEFGAWRSFSSRNSGKDVVQLQLALQELGFYTGDVDGTIGSGTLTAIREMYKELGYPHPDTRTGPALPMEEFLFLNDPVELRDYPADLGVDLLSDMLTTVVEDAQIIVLLSASQARTIPIGSLVRIDDGVSSVEGQVVQIRPTDVDGRYLVDLATPVDFAPSRIVVDFVVGDTVNQVLSVPWAAVHFTEAGEAFVALGSTLESWQEVVVEVGQTDGRLVEITPLDEGALLGGDLVLLNP